MQIHDLKPAAGSTKRRKVIGRGIGSGHGKTSTRGAKGQKKHGQVNPNFEGGQTPLHRRLPQLRGFKPVNRKVYAIVNVGQLDVFEENAEVTPETLIEHGFARELREVLVVSDGGGKTLDPKLMRKLKVGGIKVLGDGELTKKLTVKAHKFSKSAIEKLQAAGGAAEVLK
jgi:large subunit ribosomal protein L15